MWNKIKALIYSVLIRISLALHGVEQELKPDVFDIDPSKKRDYKKRNTNPLLRRMERGERDERYVQDYYEVLKKADYFIKHASSEQIEMAAEKHGMNYGKKDRWGRRFETYGFFDPKHKHYGKTLAEVLAAQAEERKTADDDYPVMFMINNQKQLDGFARLKDVEATEEGKVRLKNELERKKEMRFRIIVIRDNDTMNRIEQITDFLHVKVVSSQHKILEFFVDKKYKSHEQSEDSDIFKEITNIKQVWFSDEWGTRFAYTVTGYRKRIDYDKQYEVIKFNATDIVKTS